MHHTKKMADPKIINGKGIAEEIRGEIQRDVEKLKTDYGIVPGLAVVIVGERKDSQTYVRMKKQGAEKAGMNFVLKEVPATVSQKELLDIVQQLNQDSTIHGLIVQLPLPNHINEKEILDAVSYEKDIDGFHPFNIGSLAMKGREPAFVSCTPKGCMELLKRKGISIEGKHVVVLGRSNIVGIPVSLLALNANATVTVCHSRTKDLPQEVQKGDIVIAAVGKPQMVKKDWIKPGAIVIDVGINPVEDATKKSGFRLVGDVDFEQVKQVAGMITPVPGGVGPMTVAMLLQNTLTAAQRVANLSKK